MMWHMAILLYYFILTYLCGTWWLLKQIVVKRKRLQDIPLHTGKVAIVTGGASGIGFYVSRGLVSKNVHVFIGGKCQESGYKAIKEIKKDYPNAKVDFIPLDLASLKSVRDFADEFSSRNFDLHLLINNAGIMMVPYEVTVDGYESQLQVNYLSHFYLVQLLSDKLIISAMEMENSWSRIINVSSSMHWIGSPDLEHVTDRSHSWYEYSSHKAYADSKLMIVAASFMQARQYCENRSPVSVCAVHPGIVNSDLYNNLYWANRIILSIIGKFAFLSPEQGADTILYAALSPKVEGQTGCYYDNLQISSSANLTHDEVFQRKLWTQSVLLIENGDTF